MSNTNKLYRSNTDKVIGGVAGGLADYFNMDPVVVRILFVLLVIFGGSGVLLYIILWIAIPAQIVVFPGTGAGNPVESQEDIARGRSRRKNTSLIAGVALIAFGALILINQFLPFNNLADFWPLLLILAGVLLLAPEIFKPSKKLKS